MTPQAISKLQQRAERTSQFLDSNGSTAANAADVAGFPDPQPLTHEYERANFPTDALPETMRDAVEEVQGITQCPDSLAAFSALSTLSLAGQGLVDVERSASLCGPTSLYLMAIAESGERKSTVDRLFSAPIEAWERAQREEMGPQIRQNRAEFEIWEAKKEGTLNRIKSGQKGGKLTGKDEAELRELERNEPSKIRIPQLRHADTTPESIAYDLAKKCTATGGIISSEAGIVLGSHGMARDAIMRNLALLNALWDGSSHSVNRRTSESFHVQGVRLTMGLAAQPEVVRDFIETARLARGIGFISRFLIAWPESTQGFRPHREAGEWPLLETFRQRITELLSLPLTMDERNGLQPVMLSFSPEGKAAWINFYDDTEAELQPGKSLSEMKDIASKAGENVARIAALFHLYQNGPTGNIGEAEVTAAGRIVGWHLYEARRFLGDMAMPRAAVDAKRLSDWLVRYCRAEISANRKGVKTGFLHQRIAQAHGPVRDGERFLKALSELEDANHAQRITEDRKKLIRVNPKLWS